MSASIPSKLQLTLLTLSGGFCEYCKFPEAFRSGAFHNDHILPQVLGGMTVLINMARCCAFCNQNKHTATTGFDPVSGTDVPLFHPRRQIWKEHFRWTDDYLLIVGTTPTGRATVEKLHLNRETCINIRRVMVAGGMDYPPSDTLADSI